MNALKRWLLRKEAQNYIDNAIKESHMSPTMKAWLIGLANATISAVASGLASVAAGTTLKQSLVIVGAAAGVSVIKWFAQHPIPGGAQ